MTTSTDIQVLMVILDEVRAIRQDNADFKAEIKQDNANFKAEIHQDMQTFKTDVNTRLDSIQADLSSIKTEIKSLQFDVVGLKHDVSGLYHWDYWLLSIILVVFAMPQIVAGIKSLFSAITEGIAGIIALFRK